MSFTLLKWSCHHANSNRPTPVRACPCRRTRGLPGLVFRIPAVRSPVSGPSAGGFRRVFASYLSLSLCPTRSNPLLGTRPGPRPHTRLFILASVTNAPPHCTVPRRSEPDQQHRVQGLDGVPKPASPPVTSQELTNSPFPSARWSFSEGAPQKHGVIGARRAASRETVELSTMYTSTRHQQLAPMQLLVGFENSLAALIRMFHPGRSQQHRRREQIIRPGPPSPI